MKVPLPRLIDMKVPSTHIFFNEWNGPRLITTPDMESGNTIVSVKSDIHLSDMPIRIRDDWFFKECKIRTKNTKKCEYCDDRFKCFTE